MAASTTDRGRINPIWFAGALVVVLVPLGIVAFLGAGSASLWLDEITYFRWQSDVALRAAEIGRAGSTVAPFFSTFLFCDVQRIFQAAIVALGLIRPERDPELLVRTISAVAYAGTALLIVVWRRRSGGDSLTSLLGGLAFAGTPIFLYYAFEGRVYAFASFLVVTLLIAIERASRKPGADRLALAAGLGVAVALLHLWTVCLFIALLVFGFVEWIRRRRASPSVRAALVASFPALGVVGLEYVYMKATQPSDPLFGLFGKQPLLLTLEQTAISIFEGPAQVQHAFQGPRTLFFVVLCILLLAALTVSTCRAPRAGDVFEEREAAWVAVGSLALSVALAVGYGYFVHGRYQVPLVAALFYAVARGLSARRDRLLALLLIASEIALLPSTAAAIRTKSNNGEVARLVLGQSDRSSSAVVVQHGVVNGYPAPHHSIGLDFYLNDLHPQEVVIPIFELPGLRATNGDHGTYRYFNGGEPLLARTLEIPLGRFRAWALTEGRPDVWVIQPLWHVKPSELQIEALLQVLVEEAGYKATGRFIAPGYPAAQVVHLRRQPQV